MGGDGPRGDAARTYEACRLREGMRFMAKGAFAVPSTLDSQGIGDTLCVYNACVSVDYLDDASAGKCM